MEIGKNIKWSSVLEGFFKDMGEKSFCYGYLHKKCEAKYAGKRNFIDLPVIVLSTVAGTLSIGNSSIFGDENESVASTGIGVLSLFVSVLNTVGTYFSFAKRAEAHRQSSIQYEKLFRFLDIELSLPRVERMSPADLLKVSRDTYERLAEVSPIIPKDILKDFKKKFKKYNVSKPSEANGLETIDVYGNNKSSKYNSFCEDVSSVDTNDNSSVATLEEVVVHKNKLKRNKNVSPIISPVSSISDEEKFDYDKSYEATLPFDFDKREKERERESMAMNIEGMNRLINLLERQTQSMPSISAATNELTDTMGNPVASFEIGESTAKKLRRSLERKKDSIGRQAYDVIDERKEEIDSFIPTVENIANEVVDKVVDELKTDE